MKNCLIIVVFCFSFFSVSAQPKKNDAPQLTTENLVKTPGTYKGFPSDDFFVFNKIRSYVRLTSKWGVIFYDFKDHQTIRIHNPGSSILHINHLELSEPKLFRLPNNEDKRVPISVLPGSFFDIDVQFICDYRTPESKGAYFSDMLLESNGGNKKLTLAGGYQLEGEATNELTAKQIFRLFGFSTDIPPGHIQSEYPINEKVEKGVYGEIVVSEFWEQADPMVPVRAIHMMCQKSWGGPGVKLIDSRGAVVSSFSYTVETERYAKDKSFLQCQTIFPPLYDRPDQIAGAWADIIKEPFIISISNITTSGSGDHNPKTGKPYFLSPKMYIVRDRGGIIIPNHFIAVMDYTPNHGSEPSNSDFNDNIIYFSNIRPKGGKPEMSYVKK